MNLLPIAEYIEINELGVMAKTIFINQIPVERPNGILLRNTLQGTTIDYELPGYYKTHFQLIVRSNDYKTGQALIDNVLKLLTVSEKTIGEMTFKYMRPKSLPAVFPISKGSLVELSTNVDVVFTV